MPQWKPYAEKHHKESVTGTLLIRKRFFSPQLNNARDVLVYLPPSYEHTHQHYPVIYMHDGQNLFDAATSYAGEWHVDETLETLSSEGREAIIVGLHNTGKQRITEYNPFDHPRFGKGQGDRYLSFILDTVKPEIDHRFRTLPDRAHTGIIGSSMGGLITLYAFFRYPGAFGFAGVLSPSLWIGGLGLEHFLGRVSYVGGRLYIDVGTEETFHSSKRYIQQVRQMVNRIRNKGYSNGSLRYLEDEGGKHNEADWARRLPDALRFLLP